MTALLTDNLPLLAGAPNGIKKLRELILELAVRGKLLPQTPGDEPASELLKRIVEEKARLTADGVLKKQKTLPDVSEDEKLFELPPGWAWCRLQDAFDVRDGTHDSPKYHSSGYPLVTSKNLYTGKLDLTDVKFISEEDHQKISARSKVDRGDVLFAMIGSIGNPAIVDTDTPFSIKNVALLKQYAPGKVSSEFLLIYLSVAAADMREKSAGGVQSFVSLGSIRLYPFALPALSEQHRIAAKVDELMTLCDRLEAQQADAESAHARLVQALLDSLTQASDATDFATSWQRLTEHFHTLFTTAPTIDALRHTILELAVKGKLSAPQSEDTSISEILKKIAEEKKNTGLQKKEIDTLESNLKTYLSSIKNNRAVVRADFLCGFITKGTTPAKNELLSNGAIPFLKVYNIVKNKIDFNYRPIFISKETSQKELKRSRAYPGDVIMNIVGPPLGKVAIITDQFPEWNMNQALAVFRAQNGILNSYIYYMLLSESVLESVISESKGSAGQDNLSLAQCRALLIPIPSSEEQYRIVTKIDQLMAICDLLKTRLAEARRLNEQLASTLVEEAVT